MEKSMHGHAEWIIGYDLREMCEPVDDRMIVSTPTSTSLLRSDVEKPLSMDTSVWGSLLEDDLSDATPDYTGDNPPLWSSLSELRRFVSSCPSPIRRPFLVVALTGLQEDTERKPDPDDWPRVDDTKPNNIASDWTLLGYDVCSSHNESVLTGTLFQGTEQELDALRTQWGSQLNRFHLFGALPSALAFRDWNDEQTPGDAPHAVFGLWQVERIS